MNEIKTSNLSELKLQEQKGFQEIKPQDGMNLSEANTHWDEETKKVKTLDVNNDVYLDDDGKEYRVGDNLIPNNTFEKSGFRYEIDDKGRTKSVEGRLSLSHKPKRKMDSMESVAKGDNKDDDERGHLIAHMFGGSDGLENLVAMDKTLNHGDYLRTENEIKSALNDGVEVKMKVEPIYADDTHRPTEIRVTINIDGDTSVRVFRNGGD